MYILFHNEKAYYINIVVIGSDDNRRKTKVQNRIVGIQWNHILLTTKKGVVKNKLLLPTNQGMGIGAYPFQHKSQAEDIIQNWKNDYMDKIAYRKSSYYMVD